MAGTLSNFIGGRWDTPAAETAEVHDPATHALLARGPLCGPAEVDAAVEVACGIPTLMQGRNLEDIARGIDEHLIRQPLGVVGIIAPFNFPAMIPFWFLP
jgi:acyl-CoA reductase-like NAD-dependent aldehyde dehydrogenase